MKQWLKQLLCLHAWWCGDRDYSECLKCGKWRDVEDHNAKGREIYERVRDLIHPCGGIQEARDARLMKMAEMFNQQPQTKEDE